MSIVISEEEDFLNRVIFENIEFNKCEVSNIIIGLTELKKVYVNNLKSHGQMTFWGTIFNGVTLKGKFDSLFVSPYLKAATVDKKIQASFESNLQSYYDNLEEYALDIEEAEFSECEIRGIPARLIKRDKTSQVIVKKQNLIESDWKSIVGKDTFFDVALELFIERNEDEYILVAPKRSKKYQLMLSIIDKLVNAFIAYR